MALGGAGTAAALRITARKHFPSDTFVGGTIGYLTGEYVCRHSKCREVPPRRSGASKQVLGYLPHLSEKNDIELRFARRQFCESTQSPTQCAQTHAPSHAFGEN
jgi:hypothetical protein